MLSKENEAVFSYEELKTKVERLNEKDTSDTSRLQPLFENEDELNEFLERHEKEKIETRDLDTYEMEMLTLE